MMKLCFMIVTFLFVLSLWSAFADEPAKTTAPPLEKPGWKLTFHDEFDSLLLDDTYWFAAYRTGRIDHLKTLGQTTVGSAKAYGNHNAYYKIEDGILKLIIDEKLPERDARGDPAVSCLTTSDHRFLTDKPQTEKDYQLLEKFSQKYGWFETRCKTVEGSGLYSAFWLHQCDPLDQEYFPDGRRKAVGDGVVEIDIFEQLGKDAAAGLNMFCIHFTKNENPIVNMGFDPSKDFHTYAVDWKPGGVDWYVDGKMIKSYQGETPSKKMFLLIALFQLPWSGTPDPNMPYPKIFEVDYVRVYQREEK